MEGRPEQFRQLIKVHSGADATLQDLAVAADKGNLLVDRLNSRVVAGTGTEVMKNRFIIDVTDKARFEADMKEAGARLPEYVEAVEVEGLAHPE